MDLFDEWLVRPARPADDSALVFAAHTHSGLRKVIYIGGTFYVHGDNTTCDLPDVKCATSLGGAIVGFTKDEFFKFDIESGVLKQRLVDSSVSKVKQFPGSYEKLLILVGDDFGVFDVETLTHKIIFRNVWDFDTAEHMVLVTGIDGTSLYNVESDDFQILMSTNDIPGSRCALSEDYIVMIDGCKASIFDMEGNKAATVEDVTCYWSLTGVVLKTHSTLVLIDKGGIHHIRMPVLAAAIYHSELFIWMEPLKLTAVPLAFQNTKGATLFNLCNTTLSLKSLNKCCSAVRSSVKDVVFLDGMGSYGVRWDISVRLQNDVPWINFYQAVCQDVANCNSVARQDVTPWGGSRDSSVICAVEDGYGTKEELRKTLERYLRDGKFDYWPKGPEVKSGCCLQVSCSQEDISRVNSWLSGSHCILYGSLHDVPYIRVRVSRPLVSFPRLFESGFVVSEPVNSSSAFYILRSKEEQKELLEKFYKEYGQNEVAWFTDYMDDVTPQRPREISVGNIPGTVNIFQMYETFQAFGGLCLILFQTPPDVSPRRATVRFRDQSWASSALRRDVTLGGAKLTLKQAPPLQEGSRGSRQQSRNRNQSSWRADDEERGPTPSSPPKSRGGEGPQPQTGPQQQKGPQQQSRNRNQYSWRADDEEPGPPRSSPPGPRGGEGPQQQKGPQRPGSKGNDGEKPAPAPPKPRGGKAGKRKAARNAAAKQSRADPQ